VGKVSLTAVFIWSLLGFAGCSAIAGLDSIQEESCAPNCGDAAMNPPMDSSVQESSQADTSTGGDTSMSQDSGMTPQDSGMMMSDTGGGGQDSGVVDTGSGMDVDMNPFDSGCGDLNTTTNCSACGDHCAAVGPMQTAASCCAGSTCPGSTDGQGNSCSYTCATGYLDCDGLAGTNPPNLNGCECHAPNATASQCCSGACPVPHVTGLVGSQSYYPPNDNFYDCVPLSAGITLQLAQDACAAYVTYRGGNPATNCGEFGPTDGGPADSVCAITAGNCGSNCTGYLGDCICWTASGTYQGQVLDPVAQGLNDQCYIGQSSLTFH
jgi:hypothetical protein